jgi:hypothetical protein
MRERFSDSLESRRRAVRWHRKLLEDSDRKVRMAALELFCQHAISACFCRDSGIPGVVPRICELLIRTKSNDEAILCSEALVVQCRDEESRDIVLNLLDQSWQNSVVGRFRVCDVLRRIEGEGSAGILRKMLDANSSPLRRKSIDALVQLRAADSRTILKLIRLGSRPGVAYETAEKARAGWSTLLRDASFASLLEVLQQRDEGHRQAHVRALGLVSDRRRDLESPQREKARAVCYDLAINCSEPDVRKRASQVLGQLIRSGGAGRAELIRVASTRMVGPQARSAAIDRLAGMYDGEAPTNDLPALFMKIASTATDSGLQQTAENALRKTKPQLVSAARDGALDLIAAARQKWDRFPPRSRVAVVNLTCSSAGNRRVVLSGRLENAIEDAVTEETNLLLVNRDRLREVYEELRITGPAVLDEEKMKKLGRLVRANAIISGEFQTMNGLASYWELHLMMTSIEIEGVQTADQVTKTVDGWCRAGEADLAPCAFVPERSAEGR